MSYLATSVVIAVSISTFHIWGLGLGVRGVEEESDRAFPNPKPSRQLFENPDSQTNPSPQKHSEKKARV